MRKLFFDEDVPLKLVRFFPDYEVQSVVSMQWGGVTNGALLGLIEQERFDVFLTGDKNMRHQQRLEGRSFAVLIMSTINWPVVSLHVTNIAIAIRDAQPGTVTLLYCGGLPFAVREKS